MQINSAGITDGTAATLGDDFSDASSTTVVIPAGETSATIQVPILNDMTEEAVEFFDVTLVSSNHGEINEPKSTRVTINDDDCKIFYNCMEILHLMYPLWHYPLTIQIVRKNVQSENHIFENLFSINSLLFSHIS